MNSTQSVSYSQSSTNFQPEHIEELRGSAIDDDIANLNFSSFEGTDENELEHILTLLEIKPKHDSEKKTLSDQSRSERLSCT